ncbi:MAG TPA: hypothetical protein VJX16_05265 [Terriglobales bacterium]|nr:hypothetical protein [Terriglobales bacterium]
MVRSRYEIDQPKPKERQQAQQIPSNIPNVQQVLNEIEVNR